jgi:hypothetical protein
MLNFTLDLTIALLKHYAKKVAGDDALNLLLEQVTDHSGDKLRIKLESLRASHHLAEQLFTVSQEAENCFQRESTDTTLLSAIKMLPLGGSESLQSALVNLPNSIDEDSLRSSIINLLASDWPNLSESQRNEIARLYLSCLRRALLKISVYGERITQWAVLRTDERTERLEDMSNQIVDATQRLEEKANAFIANWQGKASLELQRYFIDFTNYITDKTKRFVGRQFVFDAFDQFLRTNTSGYFIIRGDPGIGKTAFMARLVSLRQYPHHFNIAAEGISTTKQFRLNVSAQIISRYALPHVSMPVEAEKEGNFLKQILTEAASQASGQKVVLVVDALDEVSEQRGGTRTNPLSLPKSLPAGVYLLVSTRRTEKGLEVDVENHQVLELEADSQGNLQDVWAYIEEYTQRPAMIVRLQDWKVDRKTFIAALQEKSEGNFMYLHYVLPAIEVGTFNQGHVDELPQGLLGYYEQHWQKMRGEDRDTFVRINQKVIAQLATARQPISSSFIARVTGLDLAEVQWSIEKWHEFLHEIPTARGSQFRLYHASYREFLAKQVVG